MSIEKANDRRGVNSARGASVLVGEDGVVVGMGNPAAEVMASGLFMSAGLLRARHRASDQRLQQAIQATVGGDNLMASQKVTVERADGRPLLVIVAPLPEQPAPAVRRVKAVVTVVDPDRPIETDPDLLRAMFGLTSGEARVASAIAAGSELRSISAALQITFETARQYLKSAFAKTGTHRQAELVALLSALHVR